MFKRRSFSLVGMGLPTQIIDVPVSPNNSTALWVISTPGPKRSTPIIAAGIFTIPLESVEVIALSILFIFDLSI